MVPRGGGKEAHEINVLWRTVRQNPHARNRGTPGPTGAPPCSFHAIVWSSAARGILNELMSGIQMRAGVDLTSSGWIICLCRL